MPFRRRHRVEEEMSTFVLHARAIAVPCLRAGASEFGG